MARPDTVKYVQATAEQLRRQQSALESDARAWRALAKRARCGRAELPFWALIRRWKLGGALSEYELQAKCSAEEADELRERRAGLGA